ncbi:MAG: hypothetical protein N3A60_13220 [Thermanaerothrix sp.]|jgi:hypothetical protein|uniref:50S ribosomal protein L29 n=1 Tax=Thermanaerothrix solaris TaxID=3058434 RepID=A0ABU3NNB2_9CHLR|nr:hypothetical protein [Thermanaerothrix sp. 4228-RoL]MCX8026154.1 hypothetical protein [Thermanaerothrix sp.]MDT8898331.1 hypothetical protein [Thermanaerothrix sp. 4228-RoL]
MLTLDLTPEEARVLMQVLEACVSDMRMEISQTDNIRYKAMLKERKAALERVLQVLREQMPLPLAE